MYSVYTHQATLTEFQSDDAIQFFGGTIFPERGSESLMTPNIKKENDKFIF